MRVSFPSEVRSARGGRARVIDPYDASALVRSLADTLTDAVIVKDLSGHILLLNQAAAGVLGLDVEQALGKAMSELVPASQGAIVAERDREVLDSGTAVSFEFDVTVQGRPRTFASTHAPSRDGDGNVVGIIAVSRDVTDIKVSAEQQARHTEYLLTLHETALAAMPRRDPAAMLEAIVAGAARVARADHAYAYLKTESGDGLEVEAGVGTFTGWIGHRMKSGEGLAGRVLLSGEPLLVDDYDSWEGRSPSFPRGIFHAAVGVPLTSGNDVVGVIGLVHREPGRTFSDGDVELLTQFAAIASVALENSRLYEAIERELRQREQAEEQLAFLAYHDPLTGLLNRALFEEVLELALARARRAELGVAILFLDLDDFKTVNDTLGHATGDELLRQVADRIRLLVRESDLVARQGGDEFVVLLADLDRRPDEHGRSRAVVVADAVARRIHAALEEPFSIGGSAIHISSSIGISLFPDDASEASMLLREADAAMYRSKRAGPGRSAPWATRAQGTRGSPHASSSPGSHARTSSWN